jgi:hypothetical protein
MIPLSGRSNLAGGSKCLMNLFILQHNRGDNDFFKQIAFHSNKSKKRGLLYFSCSALRTLRKFF